MRQDVELLLLVRASDANQGLERVKDNLTKFSCSAQAIARLTADQILVGDLLAPELFLDDARIDQISHVINCAAIASFGENNDIWRVNVEGTFKLAARMAALPEFVKFVHVGTAMSSAPDHGEIVKKIWCCLHAKITLSITPIPSRISKIRSNGNCRICHWSSRVRPLWWATLRKGDTVRQHLLGV